MCSSDLVSGQAWYQVNCTVLSHEPALHLPASTDHADMPVRDTFPLGWALAPALVLAGLAGAFEVAGRTAYVTLDMSPGYGYSGIVIAMLAALHPLGVVVASVFVAGVLVGSDSMSRQLGVPTYIADVIVATSLIAVLVATLFTQYRLRFKR